MGFKIQIGGKEYTPEQLRNDPDAARQALGDDNGPVHNRVDGDMDGQIQAGVIRGNIHFDR